ncbi:MAG: ACT domain-containing protein, partial [Planctomycetota bacterium]
LVGRDDVIVTPHLGASSHEAQHAVAVGIAEQVCDFFETGVAHNAVNAPAVSEKTLREIAPYVMLAERIGSFLSQRSTEPLRKFEITLSGEVATRDFRHIPLALLVGALRSTEFGVNFVNAPVIAKERGIRILEGVDEDSSNYVSLLKVRASSRGGEVSHLVAGTVFGRKPLFVRLDDQHLDLEPEGTMLLTRHRDQPGVVGRIGTALGEHGVNIRRVVLGPSSDSDDGLASAYISLYDRPSDEILDVIRALDPIDQVTLVEL